jgi:hypothetical protein
MDAFDFLHPTAASWLHGSALAPLVPAYCRAQSPDGVPAGAVIMRSGSCTRTRPYTRQERHVRTPTSHKSGLSITAFMQLCA